MMPYGTKATGYTPRSARPGRRARHGPGRDRQSSGRLQRSGKEQVAGAGGCRPCGAARGAARTRPPGGRGRRSRFPGTGAGPRSSPAAQVIAAGPGLAGCAVGRPGRAQAVRDRAAVPHRSRVRHQRAAEPKPAGQVAANWPGRRDRMAKPKKLARRAGLGQPRRHRHGPA